MIEVSLNNELREVAEGCSIASALAAWGFSGEAMFAVAVNQAFVAREDYAKVLLQAQDKIDIVQPISGG